MKEACQGKCQRPPGIQRRGQQPDDQGHEHYHQHHRLQAPVAAGGGKAAVPHRGGFGPAVPEKIAAHL